ncbi:hypothetical protein GN157_04485 [Flavobacterium rakeshii]|uniref:Uncharacterized protein n=1 Tax=Flavobacterium rakeshii TaxID=1038845 RepID=A0A6N8HAR3_9FLAO|nr:hypothetical protein [Flavobacterium rakeshii]MUV02960.1 hypothetical protein [Flavobacterium rakeshii]
MNKYLKETIWLIILLLPCVFLYSFEDPTIDINVHDTYFVIDHFPLILLLIVMPGFLIYGIRTLINKFRDKFINIVFILFTVLIALLWIEAIIINDKLSSSGGWTLYPPLSAQPQKIEHEEYYFIANHTIMITIEVILILIALFTAYKTGKNKKIS